MNGFSEARAANISGVPLYLSGCTDNGTDQVVIPKSIASPSSAWKVRPNHIERALHLSSPWLVQGLEVQLSSGCIAVDGHTLGEAFGGVSKTAHD